MAGEKKLKVNDSGKPVDYSRMRKERLGAVDPTRFDFIAATSHGFRTHLTSIKGYISLVLSGKTGKVNKVQKEFLTMVKESADSLHKLINSILDLSKIESGRIQMKRSYMNFDDIIKDQVRIFQAQAKRKGLTLKAEVEENLPSIRGDSDWLKVALGNLIDNAIKYTNEGGVTITAVDAGENVRLSISDTGVGVGKKEYERIFDPFQRSERIVMEGRESAGLGLSITRSIIERHGGSIWVESKVNQGSRFVFELPKEQRKSKR